MSENEKFRIEKSYTHIQWENLREKTGPYVQYNVHEKK